MACMHAPLDSLPLHSSVRIRNSACPVSDSSLLMEAAEQNCTTFGWPDSFFWGVRRSRGNLHTGKFTSACAFQKRLLLQIPPHFNLCEDVVPISYMVFLHQMGHFLNSTLIFLFYTLRWSQQQFILALGIHSHTWAYGVGEQEPQCPVGPDKAHQLLWTALSDLGVL